MKNSPFTCAEGNQLPEQSYQGQSVRAVMVQGICERKICLDQLCKVGRYLDKLSSKRLPFHSLEKKLIWTKLIHLPESKMIVVYDCLIYGSKDD